MKRLPFAAIALALVSACGGGGDDDDTAAAEPTTTESAEAAPTTGRDGPLDPCSLITAGEAEDVLGGAPGEPTDVNAGGVGACTYRLDDGSAAVQINVEPGDASVFEARTAQMGGESVDGVGDRAQVNGTIGQIAVVQGDVLFAIFVMLPGGADVDHATLTELGRAAAGRL
jgi:hypothetical protein